MAKRKHKVRKPKAKKPKYSVKLYPVIWCTGEDICIAVSRKVARVKKTTAGYKIRDKVSYDQWREWNSTFREGYEIDLSQLDAGELVVCPNCGENCDFRVFPSTKPPQLAKVKFDGENKSTDTAELSDISGQEV
jgi:hypothetical protein